MNDINVTQQTIYGTPRFAEKVCFQEGFRSKDKVFIDTDLHVEGHTHLNKITFKDDIDFEGKVQLHFSSNTVLKGNMQIDGTMDMHGYILAHEQVFFNDTVHFCQKSTFSNVPIFLENVSFQKDIILENNNNIRGYAHFASNISFESGISVKGMLSAEIMNTSNGIFDQIEGNRLRLSNKSQFVMEKAVQPISVTTKRHLTVLCISGTMYYIVMRYHSWERPLLKTTFSSRVY